MKRSLHSGISFAVLLAASLTFSGCSSKKYFEPPQTFSADAATAKSYDGSIVDLCRDGATLENRHYISKYGVSKISLGKDYDFLSQSNRYVLAGNLDGTLKILNRSSGATVKEVKMSMPVISAAIKNGIIAYVLSDNTFGVYSIAKDKKLTENKSEATFAIDSRAAVPMFIDNLVVLPMLDGKLIVFSKNDPENATVIYLSSEPAFNNVIYLSRMGDTMVAATPIKLLTVGTKGQDELRANISDVSVAYGSIYLFTKEGEIKKLNGELKVQAKQKFKFAHFSASAVDGGKVYALDHQGSLIVLNKNLSKYKIYDVGEVDEPVYIADHKLYKDGKIIYLSKLGYE